MTFETFITVVEKAHRDNSHWRYGQTVFNVLRRVNPTLAEAIRGTRCDPFHVQDRTGVGDCLNYIGDNWETS